MKILTLVYEYPPIGGGGGVVAASLNESLAANGHQITVVTSAIKGLPREETVRGVKVHRTSCWRKHRHYTTTAELFTTLLSAYLKARDIIQRERPDLIHTHFVIPSGAIAYLLSRQFGIPYVLTAHGSDIPGYNPDRFNRLHTLLRPFWRKIVRGASAVTSPSNFLADLIRKQVQVPVRVIPNGYRPEPRLGLKKRNSILVVSRMFPRKGVQHFIDSVRDLNTDWEIIIAGDGPYLPVLKERAKAVSCAIHFTGHLDRAALRSYYEEARILVFPSIRENFPIVLLEAMDSRCAVITTDAEGCAEVVGDTGIVIKKGNPVEIRRALDALIDDPKRCTELSKRGWERAKALRWPLVSAQYRQIFAEVCGITEASAPQDEQAATGQFPQLLHE